MRTSIPPDIECKPKNTAADHATFNISCITNKIRGNLLKQEPMLANEKDATTALKDQMVLMMYIRAIDQMMMVMNPEQIKTMGQSFLKPQGTQETKEQLVTYTRQQMLQMNQEQLSSIAKQAGYPFEMEDLKAYELEMKQAKTSGELSDEELQAVVGGASGMDCTLVGFSYGGTQGFCFIWGFSSGYQICTVSGFLHSG